jgi:hypothetical protein
MNRTISMGPTKPEPPEANASRTTLIKKRIIESITTRIQKAQYSTTTIPLFYYPPRYYYLIMVLASINTLATSLTTCIVGGGNSAHVLIPFLSEAGHHIRLLTRRPNDWHDVVYCDITDGETGEITRTHAGQLQQKSSNPALVIPGADIVILCMPVHQYRPALERLAPHLCRDKQVFVGTMYGQAGFNWMVHAMERQHGLTNIVTFAIGNIPWICRTLEYGKHVANFGGKDTNLVAVTPATSFEKLNDILLQDLSVRPLHMGPFKLACSFLSLTMSVDNQIIHPARCYALWQKCQGKWQTEKEVPYFYKHFDEASAENVRQLDRDYSAICDAIRKRFPERPFIYMLSYLELEHLNHKHNHEGILTSLRDSKQLASIKTPTVVNPDGTHSLNVNHRFFDDDIQYGCLIAKWVAAKLNVETPFIDAIILWAQKLRGEAFLDESNGKINVEYCLKDKYTSGIPESYGLTSVEDILD